MSVLKWCVVAATLAAAGFGSWAAAQDDSQMIPPLSLAIQPGVSASPAPASAPRPLMGLLDQAGLGGALDAMRLDIYGYVEGSYTYNFRRQSHDLNLGRVFDIRDRRATLNQVDLTFERTVDLTQHQLDVGGRVDLLYGGDSRFIHSSGFFDAEDFFHGPEYQFDIPQLYVDVAVPLGNGIRVRAGKFLFFKQIDPNASVFYSHSYTFGAALPFTNTGVTALYPISDQWSVEGGISRGWGQTLRDNNGAIDGLGRIRYTPSDKTTLSLAAITGPEQDHDNSHYRSAVDLTLSQALADNLTFLFDGMYGYQAGAPGNVNASWYGVAGYLVLKLDPHLSVGGRVEWYRDEEAYTTGVAQNLYEATVGLTITPFADSALGSNFKVRPEVRYDYSSRDFFNGLSRHDQITAAVDAIFNF